MHELQQQIKQSTEGISIQNTPDNDATSQLDTEITSQPDTDATSQQINTTLDESLQTLNIDNSSTQEQEAIVNNNETAPLNMPLEAQSPMPLNLETPYDQINPKEILGLDPSKSTLTALQNRIKELFSKNNEIQTYDNQQLTTFFDKLMIKTELEYQNAQLQQTHDILQKKLALIQKDKNNNSRDSQINQFGPENKRIILEQDTKNAQNTFEENNKEISTRIKKLEEIAVDKGFISRSYAQQLFDLLGKFGA